MKDKKVKKLPKALEKYKFKKGSKKKGEKTAKPKKSRKTKPEKEPGLFW